MRPVVLALLGVREAAAGAKTLLNVEGYAAAPGARSVRLGVPLTERLSTLSHFKKLCL